MGAGAGTLTVAAAGCDSAWNWVGSRTQWNVTKDYYLGVRCLHQDQWSKHARRFYLSRCGGHEHLSQTKRRSGQLAVPLPHAPRLLSLIG
jgi:hypothetical protein